MTWLSIPLLFLISSASAQEQPSADELIAAIDKNLTFDSSSQTISMTVTNSKGREKLYEMTSLSTSDKSAIEYLSPARDKGTKMLKLDDELWMYLPSIEGTQKISGHMLRQGMMGSDFSYEDMMESAAFTGAYTGTVTGAEEKRGVDCWILELQATSEETAYTKRVLWVDKNTLVPVHQDLYAISGLLVKVWTMDDITAFGDRNYPLSMTAKDQLQENTNTEITFSDLKFSVELESETFSQRWLER